MADNLPPSCAAVTKYENLNYLEPSRPFQACKWDCFTFTIISKAISVLHITYRNPSPLRHRPGVAQRVGRGIVLLFHDRGTRRGCVVISTPRPHLTPGKDPVPILQEAGWAPGPVWTGAENLVPTGIRSPDRPARIQSLYRLSYPTHTYRNVQWEIYNCTYNYPIFVLYIFVSCMQTTFCKICPHHTKV